ncbi:MAG: hypothetical protein P4L80_02510 [Xanthobacteraceae bacterium]|nr:hypothetical protein [Xanthobacteraceae bacterium]
MVSDAFLDDFRRRMKSGAPLPSPRRQSGPLGAYDASPGEMPNLSHFDEEDEETPPDRVAQWLAWLARKLSPSDWAELRENLRKSHFDAAAAAFAPPPAAGRNLPSGAASAMDSAPNRRGSVANRNFLRRYPGAANIRTTN